MSEHPPRPLQNAPSDADIQTALEAEDRIPSAESSWLKYGDAISAAQAPQKIDKPTEPLKEPVVGNEILPEVEDEDVATPLDMTPKESRSYLKRLVEKAGQIKEGAGEKMSQLGEQLKIALDQRSKELDTGNSFVKAMDSWDTLSVGGTVYKIGEEYRKAGLAYKLALSATLLGTGALVGAAGAAGMGIIATGIATQRALSSLGTYALVDALMERRLEKRGRTTKGRVAKHTLAVGSGAAVWFGLPGMAISEGLDGIGASEKMQWLAERLGSNGDAVPATPPPVAAATSEASTAEVATSDGKLLVDPARPLEPVATTESAAVQGGEVDSNVRTFNLETTERNLDIEPETRAAAFAPVPEVAPQTPEAPVEARVSSPTETGASAFEMADKIFDISVEAKEGKGYEWMLKRFAEKIPEDFVVTPNMEGSDIEKLFEAKQNGTLDAVVHKLATEHGAFIETDGTSKIVKVGDVLRFSPDGSMRLNDTNLSEVFQDRGVTPPYPPEAVPAPEVVEAPAPSVEVPTASEMPTESMATETVEETLPENTPPVEIREFMEVNKHGVEVPYAEPHLYMDKAGRLMVFGGSEAERGVLIKDYLTKNPDGIVYGASSDNEYRLAFGMTESGKAEPIGQPVQKEGFFSRLFGMFGGRTFMSPPDPAEFRRLVQ